MQSDIASVPRRSFIALMLLPAPQLREVLKTHKGIKELVSSRYNSCYLLLPHRPLHKHAIRFAAVIITRCNIQSLASRYIGVKELVSCHYNTFFLLLPHGLLCEVSWGLLL
eukprot:TRINITY_DN4767_c0_g2_i1.p2 TRINITY_DN4767_c0_g2~~TRINITY_DN4767_c0_g2_i1.p2  ORF type:complete len:111 (-),score=20.52 TRINITY_DN4767_c0_g2_i1:395-727(-)